MRETAAGVVEVTVLGTHFNVNAYEDESAIKVTLLEGSVKASITNGESTLLKPDEQAVVSQKIKVVKGVDVDAVMALFDHVTQSRNAGVRKPETRFYEMACKAISIQPTEAVFLDDLGINLKPAAALGMRTIKVIDPDVALSELEVLLGMSLR